MVWMDERKTTSGFFPYCVPCPGESSVMLQFKIPLLLLLPPEKKCVIIRMENLIDNSRWLNKSCPFFSPLQKRNRSLGGQEIITRKRKKREQEKKKGNAITFRRDIVKYAHWKRETLEMTFRPRPRSP